MPPLCFVVRLPFSSLQALMVSSPAATPCCFPSPDTVIFLSLPANNAHLCRSSINGWLLRLCPLCCSLSVLFSNVRFHPHLPPSCKEQQKRGRRRRHTPPFLNNACVSYYLHQFLRLPPPFHGVYHLPLLFSVIVPRTLLRTLLRLATSSVILVQMSLTSENN